MKPYRFRQYCIQMVLAVTVALAVAAPAFAARVAVVANRFAIETAVDFNARVAGHVFTAIDTSTTIPTFQALTSAFDVVLLYEDQTYANAPSVGDLTAAFANTGRAVVIGAFYDQDRSDGPAENIPHGWGALEQFDPNTTDGRGTPYAPRTLNKATLLRHPLTAGLNTLTSARFAGGNQAKAGTLVVAHWKELNARGLPDPAIAVRITGPACVIQVAIAPNYPSIGASGTDFDGDFHRAWKNAFDFGAAGCVASAADSGGADPTAIPTLSQWALALTVLLVGAAGALRRRRAPR